MIKLLVEVHQRGSKLIECIKIYRRIINKSPALPTCADLTADNALRLIVQLLFPECGTKCFVLPHFKDSLYYTLLLFINKHRRVGPLSQYKRKCTKNNTLTCPCFTGYGIQMG